MTRQPLLKCIPISRILYHAYGVTLSFIWYLPHDKYLAVYPLGADVDADSNRYKSDMAEQALHLIYVTLQPMRFILPIGYPIRT